MARASEAECAFTLEMATVRRKCCCFVTNGSKSEQARERAFLKEDCRKGLKVRGMSLSCEPVETAVENR